VDIAFFPIKRGFLQAWYDVIDDGRCNIYGTPDKTVDLTCVKELAV